MAIREPHVSIGHRHQPLKSSQLPIPLRHVAIRWRHQPINCPHRTIRFRHLSREWLHSGLKISTVTAGDSRPRFCLSTAPAAHVPGQPHISLRSFRLDAANRTLHKADEDTDLLQPSKRRRASLHRRRKRSKRRKPEAVNEGAQPLQRPLGRFDGDVVDREVVRHPLHHKYLRIRPYQGEPLRLDRRGVHDQGEVLGNRHPTQVGKFWYPFCATQSYDGYQFERLKPLPRYCSATFVE